MIRIPLIVHLPKSMRGLHHNPTLATFSTDITPSLYYLLGHRPIPRQPLQGRPLFTERPGEQGPYRRENYVLASSYAVKLKDTVFDLSRFSSSGATPTSSMRAEYQGVIREEVEAKREVVWVRGKVECEAIGVAVPARDAVVIWFAETRGAGRRLRIC